MEGASQRGELRQVGRPGRQGVDSRLAALHHFACFIEKNVAQLDVFVILIPGSCRIGSHRQHRCRSGRHLDGCGQGLECRGGSRFVARENSGGGFTRGLRKTGQFGQRRLAGQRIKPVGEVVRNLAAAGVGHDRCDLLGQQRVAGRIDCEGRRHGVSGSAHQQLELAALVVVDEQLPGQRRLVVEHVDEETQGAQVVAQLVERLG